MTYLAVAGILIFLSSAGCSALLFLSKPLNYLRATWALFSLAVGLWGLGLFKAYSTNDYASALFWLRTLNLSAVTIPVFFYHFAILFTGRARKKRRQTIAYYSLVALTLLVCIALPQLFIPQVVPKLTFPFYPVPGPLYYVFTLLFVYLALYGTSILLKAYRVASPLRRQQLKYFLVGGGIGLLGGSMTFLPVFGINLHPVGVFLIPFYVLSITVAMVRHRLIDIELIATRTGIFIGVYSLVLGLPFVIGFGAQPALVEMFGEKWWTVPLIASTITATSGPFIYIYIQRKAEERLLWEQKHYQTTLRQASAGMGRIRELKKLLNLIVFILTRAVRMEHALIYLYDPALKEFKLSASRRGTSTGAGARGKLPADSPIVRRLVGDRAPLVFEELSHRVHDSYSEELGELVEALNEIGAALVFPIHIHNELAAIVVMGFKERRRLYNDDDLAVFSILASQAALAIENARFYEDMQRTQEQLFQAEKMATVGTMADGLSHQINNRFHALGFIAGDALDTIRLARQKELPAEMAALLDELEHAFKRVEDNVAQGGEVVRGLLRYTRKGEEGFAPVDLKSVFKAAYEMAQFKIKANDLLVSYALADGLPPIKGNFTQLQEVFFNMIDNAYDAMKQRREDLREEGYRPLLVLSANVDGQKVAVTLTDNGMGVSDADRRKIFTPFFTTKLSSKKGTGLGLYVIKKIIEENHQGEVDFQSEQGKGTRFTLRLPVIVEA